VLRDVVAGFLDTVTEREFDAPLIALLAARGFTDVHFLHGAFEFGKDFIAKGPKPLDGDTSTGDPASWVRHQFAIQSKAGDLGLPEWRAVRPQLDEARLDDLAHPAFDRELPRAAVLVTTGRLTGGAAVQAGDYRAAKRRRGRPDFEVWDRERLLEWLTESPEAGLAGTATAPSSRWPVPSTRVQSPSRRSSVVDAPGSRLFPALWKRPPIPPRRSQRGSGGQRLRPPSSATGSAVTAGWTSPP
jgi:hypothetical protein